MPRAVAIFALWLISLPALAQEIPPRAAEVLRCGVAFSTHGTALREAGDPGAATEFHFRGEELVARGRLMLADVGFDDQSIESIVTTTTLTASFEYPFGPDEMIAGCIAAVVDEDSP